MPVATVLDVVLILLLLGYLGYGYGVGLLRTAGPVIGAVLGAVIGYAVAPVIGAVVGMPLLRVLIMLSATVLLIVLGQGAGAWIARVVRRVVGFRRPPDARRRPGMLDRLAGMVVTTAAAAFVTAIVAFGVASLGVPIISQAISTSTTITTIRDLTPEPVRSALAELRRFAIQEGVPTVLEALGTPSQPVAPLDADSVELERAAQSVVRITGNAWQCGQSQSGSGFVISPRRVLTNAHVVAGVAEPVIDAPGEPSRAGEVVYFDPERDIAVIAVPQLTAAPLVLGTDLAKGSDAAFGGYPLGGSLELRSAAVQDVVVTRARSIYGTPALPLEIYVLSGRVEPGNSGGPVLALDGTAVGMVFARAANVPGVGYAHTLTDVEPVVRRAPTLSERVPSGHCTNAVG